MAPELDPAIARLLPSLARLSFFRDFRKNLFQQKSHISITKPSYSKLRLKRANAFSDVAGTTPGLMKMPMVTGISFL